MALLDQWGLLDENGNLIPDETISMNGMEYALEQVKMILEDEDTDLSIVVEVDGQFLTLEDLKKTIEIEEYLAYIKAAYFTEQDLTDEQIANFYDMADA